MKFYKMHGAGNDYVYVDLKETDIKSETDLDWPELAVLLADRQFGIGGDGLILILDDASGQGMRMFNSDGSEAEMCGNGIRCVAKFLYDRGRIEKIAVLSTGAGPLAIEVVDVRDGEAESIRVDMGIPRFAPDQIPTSLAAVRCDSIPGVESVVLRQPLSDNNEHTYEVTCLSMGNPHCVIFTENIDDLDLERLGPPLENHEAFPARANIEFIEQVSRGEFRQRTWERGSGETLACGTGASAVAVAAALNGLAGRESLIHLRGGDLMIEWREDNRVFMTGPASFVAEGAVEIERLRRDRRR